MKYKIQVSQIVPFIRRVMYFLSAITMVLLVHFIVGKELWYVTAMTALVYVFIETFFYNTKRPFFPPIITYSGSTKEKNSSKASSKKSKK